MRLRERLLLKAELIDVQELLKLPRKHFLEFT